MSTEPTGTGPRAAGNGEPAGNAEPPGAPDPARGSDPADGPLPGRHERPPTLAVAFLRQLWSANTVTVTVLAILLALLVGAILIIISDPAVRGTYGYFFARPADALTASWNRVSDAYLNLFRGSVVDVRVVRQVLAGDLPVTRAFGPISETLSYATPLVFTGLAFALAFRGGLFNIGVQGQAILGAIGAALAGFLLPLPVVLHLVVAVVAGALFGAAWGFVPGFLKARTGAHEVIVTIMLNWVALFFLGWLIIQPWAREPARTDAISQRVDQSARLPRLLDWLGPGLRVDLGIVLAVLAVIGVAWLLKRATFGFELRAVGLSPDAARVAGMSVTTTFVLVMVVAGGLAGLGGTAMVLGPALALTPQVIGTVGFDGILVGLLGRARPWGVFAAALLFGALQAGGNRMQVAAGVSLELVQVIQALIVIFVAAPALVKAVFALRAARARRIAVAETGRGW
jgi:general nucleoside transport system permease protein